MGKKITRKTPCSLEYTCTHSQRSAPRGAGRAETSPELEAPTAFSAFAITLPAAWSYETASEATGKVAAVLSVGGRGVENGGEAAGARRVSHPR